MALFDTYAPSYSGGSLIDHLLAQLGGQFAPSQAFPGMQPSDQAQYGSAPQIAPQMQQAVQAQQPVAPQPSFLRPQQPQQAQPMQAPTQSPQQYQPQQPQGQPQQGIPDAFLQPAGGGIGGAFRGFAENAHNGLLGGIIGGIAGANGQSAGDVHNRQLQAQYQ